MIEAPEIAEHGGDLAAIARRYGVPERRLIDFSANLNPLGPPPSLVRALVRAARDRAELTRYPDDAHSGLVRAIAERHAIDPASIVIGNGAAALLDAAVRVRRFARCLVPEPAFSEDRRALVAAGTAYVPFALRHADGLRLDPEAMLAALQREGCDAVLMTNPNNPSGALTSSDEMLRALRGATDFGAFAIVDEAFIDYAPEASVLRFAASQPGTVVIRSLTKFFAVPALRVGYAVCEPSLAHRLRAVLPSWPVTSVVARALAVALADFSYERRSLAFNERERKRLSATLRKLGFGVSDAAANFLLVELPARMAAAPETVRTLIVRDGIVVRDCTHYAGLESGRFIRIAVRARRDGDRLIAALMRS